MSAALSLLSKEHLFPITHKTKETSDLLKQSIKDLETSLKQMKTDIAKQALLGIPLIKKSLRYFMD